MPIDREAVKQVALLARIDLEDGELARLSGQLAGILDFIDALRQLDVFGISPTSHILSLSDILRPDEPKISLPPGDALANAPHRHADFFSVPKVIE